MLLEKILFIIQLFIVQSFHLNENFHNEKLTKLTQARKLSREVKAKKEIEGYIKNKLSTKSCQEI